MLTVQELKVEIDAVRIPDARGATAHLRGVLAELLVLAGSGGGGVSADVLRTVQGCAEVMNQQAGQIAALAAEVAELRDLLEPVDLPEAEAEPGEALPEIAAVDPVESRLVDPDADPDAEPAAVVAPGPVG